MSAGEIAYLGFGAALVGLLAAIGVHYFARKRRAKVEQAKYKMLEDD